MPSMALESVGSWDSRPGPALVPSPWLSLRVPCGRVPGPLPSCWGPRGKRQALSRQEGDVEFGLSRGHWDHGGRRWGLTPSSRAGWGLATCFLTALGPQGWAGGPQSALRNAGRALSLTWPQVGPGGCLWTRVPHTLKLFLSRQMAWQSSWNFSLRGLLPWPRARPTCSPADGGGLFL